MHPVIPGLVAMWALPVGRRRRASVASVMVSRGSQVCPTPGRLATPGLIARPSAFVPVLRSARKALRLPVATTPRVIWRSAGRGEQRRSRVHMIPPTLVMVPLKCGPFPERRRVTSVSVWATNPFTQAGIAMLRSRSPYFAEGLGEGLAGAAGAIEHSRQEQVLDSKPVLRTEFPTLMYQYGDGRMVDTHVPNPGYDAKSVARDRLNYDITQGKKAAWKETQYTDTVSGSTMWIDGNTGRQAWTDPVNPGTKAPGPLLSDRRGRQASGGSKARDSASRAAACRPT